jgi:hypothetical protein
MSFWDNLGDIFTKTPIITNPMLYPLAVGAAAAGVKLPGGKSNEMQDLYNLLKGRAEGGLSGDVEQDIINRGLARISREAGAMQTRGAAAVSSRGLADSTAANEMLGSVNRVVAEQVSALNEQVMRLDEEVKSNALGYLTGVGSNIATLKAQREAGWGQLAGGVGADVFKMLQPQKQDPMEQLLMWLGQRQYDSPSTAIPMEEELWQLLPFLMMVA